jgi:hypothetical protein
MLKQVLILLLSVNCYFAQLPDTDIWLFSIKSEKGKYRLEKGENITNRKGYDNQPSFSKNGKDIYYVCIGEDKQADVYIYKTGRSKSLRLTFTKESEYSPTLIPGKEQLACVTVLQDSSQVILPIGIADDKVVEWPKYKNDDKQISSFDSVGYFSFLNSDTILYYKLTTPHSLRAFSIKTNNDAFIAYNPVRGFKTINRHEFIFGIKDSSKVSFYRYNTAQARAYKYCEYNSLNEDIQWHPTLGLMKSEGPLILKYDEKENKWQTIFDFSTFGIKKITRFVFDPSTRKIAIVSNL